MMHKIDTDHLFHKPEYALLLQAMRSIHKKRPMSLPMPTDTINWEYLFDIADRHGLIPALHQFLEASDYVAPDTLLNLLHDSFKANALRNRILTQELVDILILLESSGISALAYKGPVLTLQAYDNLNLRQFGDLDILIRTEDVQQACELLQQRDYQRSIPTLTPTQEKDYIRTDHEHEFISPDQLIHVDLHWSFSTKRFPFEIETHALHERAQYCDWHGQHIKTMSAQDTLLLICMHANKDLWRKLVWLCDIDNFIRKHQQIDWQLLSQQACESHCEKMLHMALLLTHDILHTPIPESMIKLARSKRLIQHGNLALQTSMKDNIAPRSYLQCLAIQPYILPLCDTWTVRFMYIARTLFTPTECDMMKVSLPRQLHFIYYIITPIRKLSFCSARFFKRLILNQ